MSLRAEALADRLEQGALALTVFASALTEAEWKTTIPKDGRKVGVVVHHVASVYPVEIQLALTLAECQARARQALVCATAGQVREERFIWTRMDADARGAI